MVDSIQSLIEVRPVLDEILQGQPIALTDEEWEILIELTTILGPCKVVVEALCRGIKLNHLSLYSWAGTGLKGKNLPTLFKVLHKHNLQFFATTYLTICKTHCSRRMQSTKYFLT